MNELVDIITDNVTFPILDLFTVPWFESHIKKNWVKGSGWNMLNVLDNAITRSARYWAWDRWTSNPPQATEPKTGFRKYPVDFTNGQKKVSKKNKY
jgi:hypothetical protein